MPDTPARPSHWLLVGLLLLVVIPPRVYTLHRAVSPARDAYKFLDDARLYRSAESLAAAVRAMNVHPAYPVVLSWAKTLYTAATDHDGAWAWFRAGQWLGLLCYVAFALATYATGCLVWSRWIAWGGAAGLSLAARQVFYSIDVLSDPLHAAVFAVAVLLAVRALRSGRPAAFATAGMVAGVGYWIRPEAVLLPMAVVATLLWVMVLPRNPKRRHGADQPDSLSLWERIGARAFSGRPVRSNPRPAYGDLPGGEGMERATPPACQANVPRSRLLLSAAVYLAALVGPVALYCGTIGEVSPRNSVRAIVGAPTVEEPRIDTAPTLVQLPNPQPAAAPIASADEIDLVDDEFAGNALYRDRSWSGALVQLGGEIVQETRGWLLLPLLAAVPGVWHWRRWRPEHWLVAALLLGTGCMMVLLKVKAGYMAGRYMMPVLPLLAMVSLTGVARLCRWAAAGPRLPWERSWTAEDWRRRRRVAAVAGLAVLTVAVSAPLWLTEPLHATRHGHMLAADWLRRHTSAGEAVFDPMQCSRFFADRAAWWPDDAAPAQWPIRYAVVDLKQLTRVERPIHETFLKIDSEGTLVASFPRRSGGAEPGVYVFELPTATAAADRRSPR